MRSLRPGHIFLWDWFRVYWALCNFLCRHFSYILYNPLLYVLHPLAKWQCHQNLGGVSWKLVVKGCKDGGESIWSGCVPRIGPVAVCILYEASSELRKYSRVFRRQRRKQNSKFWMRSLWTGSSWGKGSTRMTSSTMDRIVFAITIKG